MDKRRRHVRLIVVTAVGTVGAVLFYFLDPELGPARRAAARAWLSSVMERTVDRVLGAPAASEGAPEPFPDLTPRVEQPEPEPAPGEPLVVATVETRAEAPAQVSWAEATSPETAVTFTHGEAGPPPQIISFDVEGPEDADSRLEPPREPKAEEPEPRRGRRWVFPATVSLAAVAVGAAVGLGLWALSLSDSRDTERDAAKAASETQARAIALLSQPGAKRIPVKGSRGQIVLVVGGSGRGVLILSGLSRAPTGKTYQAWVVTGQKPKSAGLFTGARQSVVQLTQPVPRGAIVAVTLEPRGGLAAPSGTILFSAKRT
jgi:anti-sigma-K factor RskA